MTCIVSGFLTKKALKQRVELLEVNPQFDFEIQSPSIFPCGTYEYKGLCSALPEGRMVIVTNHPARTWFAQISRKGGKLRVA